MFTPRRRGWGEGMLLTLFEALSNQQTQAPLPLSGKRNLSRVHSIVMVSSIAGALDGVDGGRGAQRRCDVGQVLDVGHLDVDHHVEEIHRAVDDAQVGDVASVAESMVWMVTPLPVVMMPTMRSPGSGWQQRAKCTAMPGIRPRMAI